MNRETRLALNLLSLAMFSVGATMFVAIGTLPDLESDLGITRSEVGLIVAVYALGSALGAPLMQVFFGHLSRKRLVVVGVALMGLGTLGAGLAPSYGLIMLGRVVAAFGGSLAGPVASTLGASLVSSERRGQALAMVFGGMTIASATMAPLATWMGASLGWRPTFVLFGLTMLGFAALTAWRVPDSGPGERLSGRVLVTTLIKPVNLTGIMVSVITLTGLFTTFTLITLVFFDRIGATATQTTIAMTFFGLAGVAGNYLARYVTRVLSAERSMSYALIVIVAALLALYALPPLMIPATLSLIFWSGGLALFFPAQQQRMIGLEPTVAGLILALNTSSLYVGMSMGSWIAGWIEPFVGLGGLPLVSAAIVALAGGMLALSHSLAVRRRLLAPAR